MEPKTIGIVGFCGKYGQWFGNFFLERSYRVIGSDIGTVRTNREVVEQADVILCAVPLDVVARVTEELLPFVRPDQLWIDIASVKKPVTAVLKKMPCETVSIHPMCAPTVRTLRGQIMVVCPVWLEHWTPWVGAFLAYTQARIKYSDAETHDKATAVVQPLAHALILALAGVFRDAGVDIRETLSYMSPFYRIIFSLVGRILSQDPRLYTAIQMENAHTPKLLHTLALHTKHLWRIVNAHNTVGFIDEFVASKKYFGEENLRDAFDFFDDIIRMTADLSSEYMITLDIEHDQLGLLAKVAEIFAEEGINLTAMHSQKRDADKIRFLIGMEVGNDTSEVLRAIEKLKRFGRVSV